MKCNICSGISKLVRDHDHATGFFRGILCEVCNGRLGTYEANLKREKQRGKKKYKEWVRQYQDKIETHRCAITKIIHKGSKESQNLLKLIRHHRTQCENTSS